MCQKVIIQNVFLNQIRPTLYRQIFSKKNLFPIIKVNKYKIKILQQNVYCTVKGFNRHNKAIANTQALLLVRYYKVTSNLSQDNSPRRHRFKINQPHNLFPMELEKKSKTKH